MWSRPMVADTLLALSLTGVTLLLGHELHGSAWRPIDAVGYLLVALANLPVAARRRAPAVALLSCATFWALYISAGYWPAMNGLGSLVALYTVASLRPPPATLAGALLVGVIWVYGQLASGIGSLWSVLAQAVVFPAVVWKFGDNARKLAERNQQFVKLTTQLRLEQADRARRAVIEERVRIARELHDVVAHHLSVMTVQAGLAEYIFESDAGAAQTALGTVAESSRAAHEELRRLLQVLRFDGEGAEGDERDQDLRAVGLAQLDDLVARVRAAGVPVEVAVSGEPWELPPGPDLCAYRVVQESLTNVIKHAGATRVTIAIGYHPAQLAVSVVDDGVGTDEIGSGHGLVGMRERARLYGGTLTAGPRPEGGFAVTLTLPVRGAA